MRKVFLADFDSWTKVIDAESSKWVKSIIIHAKLDDAIVFGADTGKAVEYLTQNKTFINFDQRTSDIRITKDTQLIGEWKNQSVKTKVEDGSPFVEISADIFSVKDKTIPAARKTK